MGVLRAQNWHFTMIVAQLGAQPNGICFMVRLFLPALVVLGACSSEEPAPPVYVTSCMPCHGDGLGGAPATGDTEEWERRIAKGIGKVRTNAIDGLEGSTGVMPAKGGRLDLSDDEINVLVDYMIEASR
jgi:cytochrome c5